MKTVFFIAILFSVQGFAWVASAPIEKNYTFKFNMNLQTYEYSAKASTYEEAFEKAAQSCYNHFKGSRSISEERGIAIIDVCANPRSS